MNIDGLSESSIEKFIQLGFVNSFSDLYNLKLYRNNLVSLDGFGVRSTDKLLNSIEASKNTTLDRFLAALSIPLIGRSASKEIAKVCDYDFNVFVENCRKNYSWSSIDKFGKEMEKSLSVYTSTHLTEMIALAELFTFSKPKTTVSNGSISGKTFVITGKLNAFSSRDEAKERIEELGGKVSGSISKNTSYLINNDINSVSGKNKKAKELGIPIITEEDFLSLISEN